MTAVATPPEASARRGGRMSLWRLEWLRLTRTHRLIALVAVYLFFGLTSPALARYMGELLDTLGTGVQIVTPVPTPIDGFVTFTSNANQIGLLVFALVVSSAVAFDSQREMAVFLRTRVGSYRELLLPKWSVAVLAGIAAYLVGVVACWYGSSILLGSVDALGVVAGAACGALFLAFVGAVAAAVGARLHSAVTTAVTTLAIVLGLGVLGVFRTVGEWLPNFLLGALTTLGAGGDLASFAKSAAVTVAATGGLLAFAIRIGSRREL